MNRTNLKKLADYLASLPADYKHFNMMHYVSCGGFGPFFLEDPDNFLNTCGTTACALGHGHAAGISVLPYLQAFESRVDWAVYSNDEFGISPAEQEWEWLFSAAWALNDNTPLGAAQRIYWLLDGREIPQFLNRGVREGFIPQYRREYAHLASQRSE